MSANPSAPVPPSHFCCPITLVLMDDPVIAPDGNSYELKALQDWVAACAPALAKLPTTNLPFTLAELVPNRGLKDAIAEWRAANHVPPSSTAAAETASAASAPPSASAATAPTPAQKATFVPTPTLDISKSRYFTNSDRSAFVCVPPKSGPARPLHVVVVVDVSGSMGVVASMKDESGQNTEVTNSVLDIVKYAAKAVAHMLGPHDSFSLVSFSDNSREILSCVSTATEADVKKIDAAISGLRTEGSTNLGEGLRRALQLIADNHLSTNGPNNRLNAVIMLTDGQPNAGPVALNTLNSFRRSKTAARAPASSSRASPLTIGDIITNHTVVNTFAFGYSQNTTDLSSGLMFDVAALGNGVFGYIPDIGFLGTQFIHCLANLRCVASVASQQLGADLPNSVGLWTTQYGKIGFSCNRGGDSAAFESIDFTRPFSHVTDTAQSADNDDGQGLTPEEIAEVKAAMPAALAGFEVSRVLMSLLRGPTTTCEYNQNGVRIDDGAKLVPQVDVDGAKRIFSQPPLTDEMIGKLPGLADDINDQVVIAFRKDYFSRWGLHYLYSWLSAQQHRVCNNFKDKSLNAHKTPMVQAIHNEYDDIFNMMPPPEPTIEDELPPLPMAMANNANFANAPTFAKSLSSAAAAAAPQQQQFQQQSRQRIQCSRQINSSYNPCIHEDTRVLMSDGRYVRACDLKSGDKVMMWTPPSSASTRRARRQPTLPAKSLTIDHIIRTQCLDGKAQFVHFPAMSNEHSAFPAGTEAWGLRITPWHPVLVKNTPAQLANPSYTADTFEWMLPLNTGYAIEEHHCRHVYSFTVAEKLKTNAPVIVTEGVPSVYLAHNCGKKIAEPRSTAPEFSNASILSHPFFGTESVLAQLAQASEENKHHEFRHAPVVKQQRPDAANGNSDNHWIATSWDMSKYVGSW